MVFKYVKVVLDTIDSSWESLFLKTKLCVQILNPALFIKIPFHPTHLFATGDHELLFDTMSELIVRVLQVSSVGFTMEIEKPFV